MSTPLGVLLYTDCRHGLLKRLLLRLIRRHNHALGYFAATDKDSTVTVTWDASGVMKLSDTDQEEN